MSKKVDNKDLFEELGDWTDILNSPAWYTFVDLLNRRAEHLNKNALAALRDNNDHEAKKYAFKLEECMTILSKVRERVAYIKTEMNKSLRKGD